LERDTAGSQESGAQNEPDDVKLVELYTTAGVYYATVLIAVVVAQFAVLTFLRGKHSFFFSGSPEMLPIFVLIVLYFVVLIAGLYFADRFIVFSDLLDRIIRDSHNSTVKKLDKDVGQPHLDRRKWIVDHRELVLGAYVVASGLALAAVFCIS
jgi:hypothetical protein